MSDTDLPSVSVLMPAYNYAGYVARAVGSALDQDYPPELLKVVVVDDGSTDDTAAVVRELSALHPGRVELISQANAGPSAAINRALEAADGDVLAVLDADDVWLPGKTRRQVTELIADPKLGMVFCDMTVVDSQERVVRPSQVGRIGEFPRRAFARLLFQNVATQSSILLWRRLAHPIPPEIPYSDWWFALRAAEVAEILYIPEPLALYREHGANLTSGTSGTAAVREHRKEIAFQLWALRHLELASLSAEELGVVWAGVEEHARRAMAAAGSYFVELIDADAGSPAQVAQLLARADAASAAGDIAEKSVLLLRALAHDPFAPELKARFTEAVAARPVAG